MPDNFWYGALSINDNEKYFKQSDYNNLTIYKKQGNSDLATSYSWNLKTIQPGETIIYGMRYFFMMDNGFELITATPTVPMVKGETGSIQTYIRLLEKDKFYKVYQKIGNGQYTELQQFQAQKSIDRWIFYYTPDQTTAAKETTVTMKIKKIDDNKETNELVVKVPISGKRPTLTLTTPGKKEIYRNNESITLDCSVGGDSNSIVFVLYRNSQIVKTEKIPISVPSTSQTVNNVHDFSLKGLRSAKYNLTVYVENDVKLRNIFDNQNHVVIFTILSETDVSELKFNKSIVNPGERIELTGKFSDLDINQLITFHVQIGNDIFNSSAIQAKEENQDFSINIIVPELISEKVNCRIWSTDQTDIVSYDGSLPLTITRRPRVSIETNITDNTVSNDNHYSISVTINDDDKGTVSLTIGEIKKDLNYSTENGKGTVDFILEPTDIQNLKYNQNPHKIKIEATDSYGFSISDETIELKVMNKPILESIDIPERSDPESTVNISINYTDYDEGKTLYVYALNDNDDDNEIISFGSFQSAGTSNNIETYETKYPSASNKQYKFFLSSESSVNSIGYQDSIEFSNQIEKSLKSTKKPELSLDKENLDERYGSNETIEIHLTIDDENNGIVYVSVDNNSVTIENPEYTVSENHGEKQISLPITDYSSEKGNNTHNVDIHVKDEYGVESNHVDFTFEIVNPPIIRNVAVTPGLLRTDITNGMDVSISVTVYDKDKGKDLYFFVSEDEKRSVSSSHQNKSTGDEHTYSFSYTVKKHSEQKLPLIIWVEEDSKPIESKKYGKSESREVSVNITKAPTMIASCNPTTIGKDESITINATVNDDTKGTIHFTLNNENLTDWDFEYIAQNGEYNFTKQFNFSTPLEYGKDYILSFYPVDEYGVSPINTTSVKNCKLTYKNKPIIQDPKLSQLQADNDEIVNVSGTILDYDSGKMLHIFQKIENQTPLKIGTIESNGESKSFNLPLANLINQKSGNRSIIIWATDNENSLENTDRNSKSDDAELFIYMANDPNVSITIPDNVYQKGEQFNATIEVIADLNGTIYIIDNSYYNKEIDVFDFSGNQTINRTLSFDQIGRHLLTFIASYGHNNTNTTVFKSDITIRCVPILNNISLSGDEVVFEPGDDVYFNVDFFYNATGRLYIKSKIDDYNEEYNSDFEIDSEENNIRQIEITIPDTMKPGYFNVTIWIKNSYDDDRKYTESERKTISVLCSTAPNIDVELPKGDIYGYDEDIEIVVRINDDGSSGTINFWINDVMIKSENYTITKNDDSSSGYQYNNNFTIQISNNSGISFNSSYYHSLTVEVIDEYSKYNSILFDKIDLINKPQINDINLVLKKGDVDLNTPNSPVPKSDNVSISVSFNDLDKEKSLYLYYQLDSGTISKIGGPFKSNGTLNQTFKIDKFKLPRDITYGEHNLVFFLSTLDNHGKNPEFHNNYISTNISKSIIIVQRPTMEKIPNLSGKTFTANGSFYLDHKINAYKTATVYVNLTDSLNKTIELPPVILNITGKNSISNRTYYTVPEGLTYGPVTVTRNVESYGYYLDQVQTTTFNYKNMISIESLNITNPKKGYVNGETINLQGILNDKDVNKSIYLYYRIGGGKFKQVGNSINSTGERQNISLNITINSNNLGDHQLEIFASDIKTNIKDSDKSNNISINITLTKAPKFSIQMPLQKHYQYETPIVINTTIQDDTIVYLKGYIDNSILAINQSINVDNRNKTEDVNITIPKDIKYGYHSMQLFVTDEFDINSSVREFDFYLIHEPKINQVRIEPNWTTQGGSININLNFSDIDEDKVMYVFVQIGDTQTDKYIETIKSSGHNVQSKNITYNINNNMSLGDQNVSIWLSNDVNATNKTTGAFISNYGNQTFRVTFQPTIKFNFSDKTKYNNGQMIQFNASGKADSKLNFTFYVDKNLQQENKVMAITENQEFSDSFAITDDIGYGQHELYVKYVDINGFYGFSQTFSFNVSNVPQITDFSLSESKIIENSNLSATIKYNDRDNTKELNLYIQFNKDSPIHINKIESKGKEESYVLSVDISSLAIGNNSITTYIIDSENHTSNNISLHFEITKVVSTQSKTQTVIHTNTPDSGLSSSGKKKPLVIGVSFLVVIGCPTFFQHRPFLISVNLRNCIIK